MIVRKASLEDVMAIYDIACSVELIPDRPQERGFLVYPLAPESYARRINSAKYFYVALEEGKVVGFLMCYEDVTLKEFIVSNELDHEDGLTKKVSEQAGRFVFGDQIGVIPDESLRGVGKLLMYTLFDDMRRSGIHTMYVGVLHSPAMNAASKVFCERLGFVLRESVVNSDGSVWGVYQSELE